MIPNFVQAGHVLDDFIRRRWHDSSQWLRSLPSPPCSPATMRAIGNGSYNSNMGATISTLWSIILALSGNDVPSAQALMALYLSAAGIIPEDSTALIHLDLARCRADLQRATHAVERLARKHEREAGVILAESAPEPQVSGDGQSDNSRVDSQSR